MDESKELELQAVGLVKTYGWALPAPAKDFFRRLATHLNWTTLREILK